MKYLMIAAVVGLSSLNSNLLAQGCSDAGFCSVGNLGVHANNHAAKKHYLQLTTSLGVGDDNVVVFTPTLEYGTQLGRHWQAQGKVTANYASGNLGDAFGAGDVFLSGTYLVDPTKKWQTSFTLGAKLPLNQSNLEKNGLSLPMQYQSSLGTIDVIGGIAITSARWQFAAGWQQPVSGINLNHFLPVYYSDKAAMAYPPTNDFNRKGDVLLRSNYNFKAIHKLSFNTGLLAIYHLGKDTYINANVQNKPIDILGSEGLTLNATVSVKYPLGNKFEIGLSSGIPLVIRDVRPDGLTRSFVIAPTIKYQF